MNFYSKLEEAEKSYESCNYRNAIRLYEELIENCPKDFKITVLWYNLGMAFYNLAMEVPNGNYDEEIYEEAIELVKKAKKYYDIKLDQKLAKLIKKN